MDQPAQQRRHRVDGEADRRLRLDQVTDPVGQQPADVPDAPHVAEPGDLDTSASTPAPGQVVQPERVAVDRDDVVTHPGEPAQHRHVQAGHRARARQQFRGRHHGTGRPQGPQEEEGQEQRPDQPHTQWRDLDGRVRPRTVQPESGHVTGRRDRTARTERHHRRGHRTQRPGRVRAQQPQTERRRARHPDQRPAHGGDRGHQYVTPRHPGAGPARPCARGRAHGRPPDPRRGPVAAHVPLAWNTTVRAGFNPVDGTGRWPPAQVSQGPTFGQGAEPEIVPPDVRHP